MKNKIFISEFNLSYQHGGGLTCYRVLGEHLWSFDHYYSLHFTEKDFPTMPEIISKSSNLSEFFPYPNLKSGFNLPHLVYKLQQILHRFLGVRINNFEDYHIFSQKVCDYFLSLENISSDTEILVIPQGNLSIDIVNALHKKYKIKYITWMMDDHLLRFKNGNWTYPRGFESKLKYHLKNACKVITISPSMASYYKQRFNVDSEVLFGGASFLNEPILKETSEIKLAYFGSLHEWQIDSLVLLIPCLEKYNIKIHIYSYQNQLPEYLINNRIVYKGSVEADKVIKTMQLYHGILIPVSFKDAYRHMVELNIATKMSECISSGSIPVVIGPTYSAMLNFINKRELGIVISSDNDLKMLHKLTDLEYQKLVSLNAKICFDNEISNKVIQKKWNGLWGSFKIL